MRGNYNDSTLAESGDPKAKAGKFIDTTMTNIIG
jgi:hypothetical protein